MASAAATVTAPDWETYMKCVDECSLSSRTPHSTFTLPPPTTTRFSDDDMSLAVAALECLIHIFSWIPPSRSLR